jgi:hypothetical protein
MIRGRENPIGEKETEAAVPKIGDRDEGEGALEIRSSCTNRTRGESMMIKRGGRPSAHGDAGGSLSVGMPAR